MSYCWLRQLAIPITVVAVLFSQLISGCARQVPISSIFDAEPLVEPIDMNIGVFYDATFLNFKYEYRDKPSPPLNFAPGRPSAIIFTQLLEDIFARVVVFEADLPKQLETGRLDAMIVPRIDSFLFYRTGLRTFNPTFAIKHKVEISYYISLRSVDGKEIASMQIRSSSSYTPSYETFIITPVARWAGTSVDIAIREAAATFAAEFSENPNVKGWLNKARRKSKPRASVEK